MLIHFYENKDKNNKAYKTLIDKGSANCQILDDTSMISPIIEVENFTDPNINYCYIPDYNRYYYLYDMSEKPNGFSVKKLKCDVLMSFIDQISNNDCIIARNQYRYNLYLNDGQFKVQQNPIITTREFPNGFTTPKYVLIANTANKKGG